MFHTLSLVAMQIQTFVSPLPMALGLLNQMRFNLQVFQPEITILFSSNMALLGTMLKVRLLLRCSFFTHPSSNPRLPMQLTLTCIPKRVLDSPPPPHL